MAAHVQTVCNPTSLHPETATPAVLEEGLASRRAAKGSGHVATGKHGNILYTSMLD